MRRGPAVAALIGLLLGAGTALVPAQTLAARTGGGPVPRAQTVLRGACALDHRANFAHCSLLLLGAPGHPNATSGPSGYVPSDLQSAYGLNAASAGGANQTLAIVDAFDDPDAERDMNAYRSQFGIPACTSSTGCLRKVNQSGVQGSYPRNDQAWALEISLDLDMASAICPNCHILLVEASSNSTSNLYAAEDTAARLGANEISNSWGAGESSGDTAGNVHFDHPGVAVTASSGDGGYGVEYPAASPKVTAVGGTTLSRASTARGWAETAWSGAGSGCSAFEAKPTWQKDTGCSRRTVADVSAVADPHTGVAVYDTDCNLVGQLLGQCFSGWGVVGGTSASSPIVAGVYALAGNASSIGPSYPYAHTGSLNDVTAGSNGSCAQAYLCTAGAGYDGPTGLGTPAGTGAF